MRKTLKRAITSLMAGVMLMGSVAHATPVEKAEVKKPLARYNAGIEKANNFFKEVEVIGKDGKKEKKKVETYTIVTPEEVLAIDTALQDYTKFSLSHIAKGHNLENLISPLNSLVGVPTELAKSTEEKPMPYPVSEERRQSMSRRLPESYFEHKEIRDLKVEEGYDFFKDITREQFEQGIDLVGSVMDLRRVQFILSPYQVSGGKEYSLQGTPGRYSDMVDTKVNRVAKIVIEPVEGNNIIASAWTGLGRILFREIHQGDYATFTEYEGIYGTEITGNRELKRLGFIEDAEELSFAEDFRRYLTKKLEGKNPEIDKIIQDDIESFTKKDTKYSQDKEQELEKYFDKLLKENPYEVEAKRFRPEIRIYLKDQDGYIDYLGNNLIESQYDRLYTTADEIIIKTDGAETVNKLVDVKIERNRKTDFAYINSASKAVPVPKNANGEYRIKLSKGTSIIEFVTTVEHTEGGIKSMLLEITKE